MKYCPYCQQNIEPTRRINWVVFLICLILGVIPAIVYWYIRRGKVCPMCRAREGNLEPPHVKV